MLMRRTVVFLAALLLLLVPAAASATQTLTSFNPTLRAAPGPGGLLGTTVGASVTVINESTARTLFTASIPAAVSQYPLHVRLYGVISTSGAGTGTAGDQSTGAVLLTANYGGATASLTVLNCCGFTSRGGVSWGYASAPVVIDVYMRPLATSEITSGGVTTYTNASKSQFLAGTIEIASANTPNGSGTTTGNTNITAGGSARFGNGTVIGTTDMTAAQTFAINWQWASAAAGNGLILNHAEVWVN